MGVHKLMSLTNAFQDIFVCRATSEVPVADRSILRRSARHRLQHSVIRTELYCVTPIMMSGLRPSRWAAYRLSAPGEYLPFETVLQ